MDNIPIIYSNETSITSSNFDFVIGFNQNVPQINSETNHPEKNSIPQAKVIMSPQHYKIFANIILDQLNKYETQFGEIIVNPKQQVSK